MKKIFTFSFALMASATMFAQTTLWDGDNISETFWTENRCKQELVDTPKGGINQSDKCWMMTITGNVWNNGSAAKNIFCQNFDSKRISLMIKKEKNSNVKLAIKCNDKMYNVVAWYDGGATENQASQWRKLYFDFSESQTVGTPTEINIYPTTDDVTGEEVVYLDNIQIEEAPKVNGTNLAECNSLSGNLNLTGSWLKGECQNADGEKWQKVEYNDFASLAGKLTDGITTINMRDTKDNKDVDIDGMIGKRPNVLVFTKESYAANNVVANGKCASLVLDENKTFFTPEGDFTAEKVTLNRPVHKGYNTMCLPFGVNANDLKADAIYAYDGETTDDKSTKINFKKVESVEANVPFIAYYKDEPTVEWDLKDKGVVATNNLKDREFFGNYEASKNAKGLYGLNTKSNFQRGGDNATINAFHAYLDLNLTDEQAAKPILLAIDGETTGINAATIAAGSNEAVKVYNLQGCLVATAKSLDDLHLASGVYIVNNKKMVVK